MPAASQNAVLAAVPDGASDALPYPPLQVRATTALLAAFLLGGCVTPPLAPRASASAPAPAEASESIGRAASILSKQHFRQPDRIELVRTAVRAVDEDAVPAASSAAPAGDVDASLRAALARHRAARPDRTEQDRAELGIGSMARSIDGDTGYFLERELRRGPPDAADAAGIGVVVALGPSVPEIRRVLVDGPAARAGLQAGLELRTIDGAATSGLTLAEVLARLKGPAGSPAVLGVGLPGSPPSEVRLTRALVSNRTDCRVIEGGVLYLRPGPFDRTTTSEVKAHGEANPSGRGVILDLRGNRGGLLDQAAGVADLFLADGVIYGLRGKQIAETRRAAAGTSPLEIARLVVLVDHETGSGAEVVAASLQDAQRATVLGEPTEGRAVVAALFQIPGYVLKVPVGELLRPSGAPIGPSGVKPDHPPPVGSPADPRSDIACQGVASPSRVTGDPLVALAVTLLVTKR